MKLFQVERGWGVDGFTRRSLVFYVFVEFRLQQSMEDIPTVNFASDWNSNGPCHPVKNTSVFERSYLQALWNSGPHREEDSVHFTIVGVPTVRCCLLALTALGHIHVPWRVRSQHEVTQS